MSLVSTQELLVAALWERSATGPERGCPLETVVAEITGGGDRLSKQMEVAVAVEQLISEDILRRETERQEEERLYLSSEGTTRAKRTRQDLAETKLTVFDEGDSEEMVVAELAEKVNESIVHVGSSCSENGKYYLEDDFETVRIINRNEERERWKTVREGVERQGEGGLVLIEGPGGIGKTTLGDAFLSDVATGTRSLQTRCQRASSEPFQPLRDVLESVAAASPLDSTGPGGAPAVATDVEQADAYDAQRTALFHEITAALVPRDEPTVLLVDDIGRADESTRSYLTYLIDRLENLPLVLVGTYRPETIPEESPLAPGNVPDGVSVARLELSRFDRAETATLIERVTGRRGAPDKLVDAVYEKTSGTPMFVKSTVEALLDSDQLDAQYQWYPESAAAIDLPDAVQETVSQRIETLDDRSREILRWTSLSSLAVPEAVLTRLVEGTSQQVTRGIDILVDAAVLERRNGSAVSLRSNVIRDALQGDEIDDKTRLHRMLAAELAEFASEGSTDNETPGDIEVDLTTTIAYHYECGDNPDKAIEWYEQAIEQAKQIYAHETAISHYHQLLDIARGRDTETVRAAGEELAEMHLTLGEYDKARQYVQFVRERVEAEETVDRQRLAKLAASVRKAQNNFEEARKEIDEGLAIDDKPTKEQCELLLARIDHELSSSNFEAANETISKAFNIAETVDDPDTRARCFMYRGWLADAKSEYETAKKHYETALDIFEAEDSKHNVAHMQNALGNLVRKQGEFAAARSYHETARKRHEEVGDKHAISQTLNNLGLVAWRQSEYEDAREYFEESVELYSQLQNEYNVARARHNLANVFREQGDYDRASTLYDEALPVFEAREVQHMVAIADHDKGKLANRRGEYETARECCTNALSIYEENNHHHHIGAVRNVLGLVATNLDEYETALQYFDTATELAERVGNDALLGKIYANWSILAVEQDRGQQALDHAETALSYLEDGQNRWFIGRVYLTRGRVALDNEAFERATRHTKRALGAFERVGANHGQARAKAVHGCICHRRGDRVAAHEYYDAARKTFESIGAAGDLLAVLRSEVHLADDEDDTERLQDRCRQAIEVCEASDSEYLSSKQSYFETKLTEIGG